MPQPKLHRMADLAAEVSDTQPRCPNLDTNPSITVERTHLDGRGWVGYIEIRGAMPTSLVAKLTEVVEREMFDAGEGPAEKPPEGDEVSESIPQPLDDTDAITRLLSNGNSLLYGPAHVGRNLPGLVEDILLELERCSELREAIAFAVRQNVPGPHDSHTSHDQLAMLMRKPV